MFEEIIANNFPTLFLKKKSLTSDLIIQWLTQKAETIMFVITKLLKVKDDEKR